MSCEDERLRFLLAVRGAAEELARLSNRSVTEIEWGEDDKANHLRLCVDGCAHHYLAEDCASNAEIQNCQQWLAELLGLFQGTGQGRIGSRHTRAARRRR